jgi:hypothetical protein
MQLLHQDVAPKQFDVLQEILQLDTRRPTSNIFYVEVNYKCLCA